MKDEKVSLATIDQQIPTSTQSVGPGILIFSSTLELQYLNQEARRLIGYATQMQGISATGVLPSGLTFLLKKIQERLQVYTIPKDWEEVDITQTFTDAEVPILVRGFGLPDPADRSRSRILVLLEERLQPVMAAPAEVRERFPLTGREQAVLKHLSQGLTNKEIAAALDIAEPTVKEHVQSMMRKTKTSTRTALLVAGIHMTG